MQSLKLVLFGTCGDRRGTLGPFSCKYLCSTDSGKLILAFMGQSALAFELMVPIAALVFKSARVPFYLTAFSFHLANWALFDINFMGQVWVLVFPLLAELFSPRSQAAEKADASPVRPSSHLAGGLALGANEGDEQATALLW